MEYRQVTVTGRYDNSQQIAIANQSYGNGWGVDLVTPLVIDGTNQAILVDRGWIPADAYKSNDWSQFNEDGEVSVSGVLRRPQVKADFGGRTDAPLAPGEPFRSTWNFVNIAEIDKQISYDLLPAYVQEAPNPAWTSLPYRSQPQIEISEGPHQGYALQWFTFATLLGVGYPFFVYRQERKSRQMPRSEAETPRSHTERGSVQTTLRTAEPQPVSPMEADLQPALQADPTGPHSGLMSSHAERGNQDDIE
jgi:surfeit locus 1 family protein